MPPRTDTYDVLGVNVSRLNLEEAARIVGEMVSRRDKGYVCVAPVSTVVDCRRSESYRKIINNADLVTPDGMPVVWVAKCRGFTDVARTYGPDLMMTLSDVGQEKQWKHFFYGATRDVCDKLVTRLKARFPKINVVGTYAPPFTPDAQKLSPEAARIINDARPDILWIGLGSPKQDHWIALNRAVLDVPVMIGIGAAFDFHAGVKPQAPLWMQRSGLEWVFRLCSEPRRLWKRYLVGNTLFVWWLLYDALAGRDDR